MFYCKKCGEKRGYPLGAVGSWGNCEICKEIGNCADIPSGFLSNFRKKGFGRMKKQKPMIMESPLTGEFYYVNKYQDLGNGKFLSLNKRKATEEEIKEYKKGLESLGNGNI